ncbi:MAG: ATP-dependent 6-phosphofructokinase [Lachnospiraceae bacterium]
MGNDIKNRKIEKMSDDKNSKAIAVLTSGGDSPGMNAAIRGIYSRAEEKGYRVIGIRDGYEGLLNEDMFELSFDDVAEIIPLGGTMLGSSRCQKFHQEETQAKAADICRKHGIESLIVIGGDGSFQGALRLYEHGIPVIGIPGTIDLDIACTDYTLGFDTSVNAVIENIDRIYNTSKSHSCYTVVEVMGRHAGYIAMWSGISESANCIIIPEDPDSYKSKSIIQRIKQDKRKNGVIVLAEACGQAKVIAEALENELGVHTRQDVLGFLQRGGSPSAKDRVYGCAMGSFAVDLIEQGQNCHVVAEQHGELVGIPIEKALSMKKEFPKWLSELGRTISKAK